MSLSELSNPTGALVELHVSNKHQSIDNFPTIVTNHFKHLFEKRNDFMQIPVLDLSHPPQLFSNGCLVVFDAMVQDTSLPAELYLATRKNGEPGGWGITEDPASQGDVDHKDLRECSAFWAVTIPGLSPWCGNNVEPAAITSHTPVQPHKYPTPSAPHIGVQLKIYDENIAQSLRITDLASFVGILTFESLQTGIDPRTPVHVPTLHVLFSMPIPGTIVPRYLLEPSVELSIAALREELIQWIADEGLAGDRIAAEWIILASIARVRSRQPPILPLSLTISGFPSHPDRPDLTPVLYDVLSQVFPLVTRLPLSLDTLNTTSFYPESKDEDLHSGQLQLPKGSIMLLTEGAVAEGGIFNKGVMNIRAVQGMINSQTLDYIFPFNGFQFETDISFLITTEGKKSTFFQTDVTVPLRPATWTASKDTLYKSAESIDLPSPDKLQKFRQLVGGAKSGNVTVAEVLGKHVEDDFIRERSATGNQINGPGRIFTPDDLVQRMLVARLSALSLHQAEVTVENWESAKELERQTRARQMS